MCAWERLSRKATFILLWCGILNWVFRILQCLKLFCNCRSQKHDLAWISLVASTHTAVVICYSSKFQNDKIKLLHIILFSMPLSLHLPGRPWSLNKEILNQNHHYQTMPTLIFLSELGVFSYIISEPLMSQSLSISPCSSRKGQLMDGISFSIRAVAPISCMPNEIRMPPRKISSSETYDSTWKRTEEERGKG